eukprot:COSAG06_NODE_224_length_19789_cov_2569.875622_4_plen_51_part_00
MCGEAGTVRLHLPGRVRVTLELRVYIEERSRRVLIAPASEFAKTGSGQIH